MKTGLGTGSSQPQAGAAAFNHFTGSLAQPLDLSDPRGLLPAPA
jgi:hypothetical protein